MRTRFFALLALGVCAAASQAQSVFFGFGQQPAGYIQVTNFGLATAHPLEEVTHRNVRTMRTHIQQQGRLLLDMSVDTPTDWHDWIKNSIEGKVDRKSISIIFQNDATGERTRTTFFECWPLEMVFPACDAKNPAPAGIKVKLGTISGSNENPQELKAFKQKQWTCSNFRLRIDGLDDACSRVTKIEAITVKQVCQIGGDLDGDGMPDYTISDLVFTLPYADRKAMLAWYSDPITRNGSISYLDADGSVIKIARVRITNGEVAVDKASDRTIVRCTVHRFIWDAQAD